MSGRQPDQQDERRDAGAGVVPGTPARRRPRARWAVGAVAAAALAMGGGAVAAQRVGLLGAGGATPDRAVPGSAVAYLRIDTNPDVGQKVAAFRLLGKLPEVRDAAGDGKDWRRTVFDQAKGDSACLKDKDFDRDVKPWLGDRAAMAAYVPGPGQAPVPLISVAVTDEEKARQGLPALLCGDAEDTDVRWVDGYAVLTERGKGDATVAAIRKGALHDDADFTHDMEDLGSDGIASLWVDSPALAQADLSGLRDEAERSGSPLGDDASQDEITDQQLASLKTQLKDAGRVAAAVRLDADHVELAGVQRGGKAVAGAEADKVDLGSLPKDTVGAVGAAGLQQALRQQWPTLVSQMDQVTKAADGKQSAQQLVAQAESSLGISLPEDLGVLLGRRTVLAVADQDFTAISSTTLPKVGLRTTTDATKAQAVTDKLLAKVAEQQGISAAFLPVRTGADGDTFTLALDDDYRRELASTGALREDEGFVTAVGEGRATSAAYVDLDRIEKYYLDQVPQDRREFVRAMRGIGLVSDQEGGGRGHFTLRLVAD